MDSPIAVKVEGPSHSVILTYFQGDINSMVDAHFTRALSKVYKAKEPAGKIRKIRKTIKIEEVSTPQDGAAASFSVPQVSPGAEHILNLSSVDDTPASWQTFTNRNGEASGLPTIMCSLSSGELSLTGQQYATSLLNLLHSDRADMGPSTVTSSKAEPMPSWTVPQRFREPVDPPISFEAGQHVDKRDLYWY